VIQLLIKRCHSFFRTSLKCCPCKVIYYRGSLAVTIAIMGLFADPRAILRWGKCSEPYVCYVNMHAAGLKWHTQLLVCLVITETSFISSKVWCTGCQNGIFRRPRMTRSSFSNAYPTLFPPNRYFFVPLYTEVFAKYSNQQGNTVYFMSNIRMVVIISIR
jgi:hypothetical protein